MGLHKGEDVPCRYGCGLTFSYYVKRGTHEKKVHGALFAEAAKNNMLVPSLPQ